MPPAAAAEAQAPAFAGAPQVNERQELARMAQWQEEAAQLLQLPLESVVEGRVAASDEMCEMLGAGPRALRPRARRPRGARRADRGAAFA